MNSQQQALRTSLSRASVVPIPDGRVEWPANGSFQDPQALLINHPTLQLVDYQKTQSAAQIRRPAEPVHAPSQVLQQGTQLFTPGRLLVSERQNIVEPPLQTIPISSHSLDGKKLYFKNYEMVQFCSGTPLISSVQLCFSRNFKRDSAEPGNFERRTKEHQIPASERNWKV